MMTEKISDQWQTPDWLFKELDEEFNFLFDLCSTNLNAKVGKGGCYHYRLDDYLNNTGFHYLSSNGWQTANDESNLWDYFHNGLRSTTCFMNPPYSNPKPFIEKAWEDSKYCKIVCLVKCDPSTKWWSTFWDYNKEACSDCGGTNIDHVKIMKEFGGRCHDCKILCNFKLSNGPKPGCEVRFFPKRIKFDPPKGWEGKASSPSFASALIIMDRRGL